MNKTRNIPNAVVERGGRLRNWTCVTAILVLGVHLGQVQAQGDGAAAVKVTGRVINEEGNVLDGALIRVAIPAEDMRHVYPGSGHRTVEGETDAQGRYAILVSLNGASSLSVDAMKPGFRSAAGTYRSGGDRRSEPVEPGGTFEASFVLERSLYIAGTIVDEGGAPIPNVEVSASLCTATSCGGVSTTMTDSQGRFEVFNFPTEPRPREEGRLRAECAHLLASEIDNIYDLAPQDQTNLRIVLKAGRKMSGRVVDANGKPAGNALIEAMFGGDYLARRATLTGSDGRFALAGLVARPATICVHALPLKQHLKKSLVLDHDYADLELRLEPIAFKQPVDAIELFGMKLATITPELREAYLLDDPAACGVIILDPGKNSTRLNIGELCEGDYFLLVGNGLTRVKTLPEFVERLRARIADTSHDPPYAVHVVYLVRRVEWVANNTQYLKLTADDTRQLDVVAAELARRPPVASGPKQGFLGLQPEDYVEKGLARVRIASVEPGTPAARAGLAAGETVVKVDGVEVHTSAEFVKVIRSRKPGDKITLKLVHSATGSQSEVVVTLDEY